MTKTAANPTQAELRSLRKTAAEQEAAEARALLDRPEPDRLADELTEAIASLRKARASLDLFGSALSLHPSVREKLIYEIHFDEPLLAGALEDAENLPTSTRGGHLNGLIIQARHLLAEPTPNNDKPQHDTLDDWAPTAYDLLNRGPIPPVQWLIHGLLPTGGLLALQGAYKSGKTELLLELAITIATGEPCFGQLPVDTQGPVLLLLEESMEVDTQRRVDQLARGRNLKRDDERLRLLRIPSNRGITLTDPEWMQRITKAAQTIGAVLVAFDPLVRVKGIDADENQQADMAPALQALVDLRRATGATVGFSHHVGHGETHRMRGSSDFEAWWSTKIAVTTKGKSDEEQHAQPARHHRPAP